MFDDARRSGRLGSWLTKAAAYVVARGISLQSPRLIRSLGGGDSHAGKLVTVETALQLATAWACVRLIAQSWGTLPVEVKVWNADSKALMPSRDHPLHALLHDAPNADMTAVEFWTAMGANLMTRGNAYAEISRVMSRVVAITPLSPDLIMPYRVKGGAIFYRYSDPKGPRDIAEDDMLHIKGLSLDGLVGMSPIAQARHSLGLAMAADETAGKLFANGLRIGGYLSAPDYLNEPQREQARVMLDNYRSAQNAGRPIAAPRATSSEAGRAMRMPSPRSPIAPRAS